MKRKLNLLIFIILTATICVNAQAEDTTKVNKTDFYKNRIGIPPIPTAYITDFVIIYERKLPYKIFKKRISVGLDMGFQHTGSVNDFLYEDEVNFKTKMHSFNPWFIVSFRKDGSFLKDLFIPKLFIVKPSFVFLDTGADGKNIELFPAYEIMLGQIVTYKRFFLKIDYGIKHF